MANRQIASLEDFLAALGRRKGRAAAALLTVLALATAAALLLPSVYRSSATILIEQQEIPQDLVRSTITTYADQRIQVISQRVMTRSNLLQIIEKYDLYPRDREREPSEVIVERMREDIRLNTISADVIDPRSGRPTSATIAFSLSFDYENPDRAEKVTNELTTLYLNENFRNRTKTATDTSDFIGEEVARISSHIAELEKELAGFKEVNAGRLPEVQSLNLQLLDRTERDLLEIDRQLRTMEERRIQLESELTQASPYSNLYAETGERILSPVDKLKTLEASYVSAAAIYSEAHPDIVRMKRELDALRQEVTTSSQMQGVLDTTQDLDAKLASLTDALRAARERYAGAHPQIVQLETEINRTQAQLLVKQRELRTEGKLASHPDNPAYIRLRTDLEAVMSEQRALQAQRKELAQKIALYEQRVAQAPQVEKEYRAMKQDLDAAWIKHTELRAKEMEAQIAKTLEAQRKAERFALIEPPLLPEKPIAPNRFLIFLFGVLTAFAVALGVVVTGERFDKTIRGTGDIESLLDAEPLAAIPYIATRQDTDRRSRWRLAAAAGVGVIVIGAVLVIHWMYVPLDVVMFSGLRRLGWVT